MFLPFLQVLIPTEWSFSMKAITENQLHDFLINSKHSCEKYCLHIRRNYNHRRSSDKIWAQEGRLFRQKVIFPSFSSVIMNFFFSPIGLVSFIDPLHQKLAKA